MVRYRKPTQQTSRIEDRRGRPGMRRGGVAVGGGGGLALILVLVVAVCGGGGGIEDLGGQGLIELDPGEVGEALEVAAAVGDDTGRIDPEKVNHGTSAQRYA